MTGWGELERQAPPRTVVGGVELRRGSRVRLLPRGGGDVFATALAGKAAVIESIEEGLDGQLQLAVTVEDDPGRDLGDVRMPGHRFFFSLDEVEPLPGSPPRRILVAGIGNVFLADDAFGTELARRLLERELPDGVTVRDFGIRGMDLAYTLGEDWDVAVLLDAVPLGERPGTVSVLQPDPDEDVVALDGHGMDPLQVLRLARELGPLPGRTLVVGCQPQSVEEEMGLSEPVRAALDAAVGVVEELLAELTENEEVQR